MTAMRVLIPTTGQRPALLERTLRSILDADRPDALMSVDVLSNGTAESADAKRLCESLGYPVRFFHHDVAGKNVALNAHLAEIADEFLVFADDDVRYEPNVLTVYAEAAEPGCFFGGPTACDYEQVPPAWLESYLPVSARGWSADSEELTSPCFLGFNWAAWADDLRRVGGFDETVGPGRDTVSNVGDEMIAQQALLDAGFKAKYLADALVHHHVPADRCSPTWAVRRAFDNGVSRAKRGAAGGQLRTLTRVAKSTLRKAAVRVMPTSPQQRFHADYWHAFDRGLLRGAR
ncbi:MAG: glycosyltransferase family 2 protein [Planctomycetota bacterium]